MRSFSRYLVFLWFWPAAIGLGQPIPGLMSRPESAISEDSLARYLHLELAFLRRAVPLTGEQEAALTELTLSKLEGAREQRLSSASTADVGSTAGKPSLAAGPLRQRQLERLLAKAIDQLLSDEQRVKYLRERQARQSFDRDVAIAGLLFLLNQKLSLSANQRQAIAEVFRGWPELLSLDLRPYQADSNYLPLFPDELIVAHLDEAQRRILSATPRIRLEAEQQPLLSSDLRVER
jgi:hypothetical protein